MFGRVSDRGWEVCGKYLVRIMEIYILMVNVR